MTTTTYYDLNIVEGTDIVNPLTVDNPNYEIIDEVMHDNAVSGVTLATEIANATVHAITRENSECAVIRFIATSEWKAGDTVTVDGVPVTALLPSGETLPNGAYVINANVLCILTGTNLTVYAERKKTNNANEIAYNETTVGAELTALNENLSKQKVVIGINPSNGSIVSTNASYMQGNVLFIDVIFNISVEVAESGDFVSFVVNGQNIYFPKRHDLCLYGINNSQVAINKLLVVTAGGNTFFANGSSIPAGMYKLTAILDLN